jgi:hypothetical protein
MPFTTLNGRGFLRMRTPRPRRISSVAVPVPVIDDVPNAFSFTPQSGVDLSTLYESNTITVSGINTLVPVSISGGEYSENGGAYTAAQGSAAAGDTFKVRLLSSSAYVDAATATLTIGGVSSAFSITTKEQTADGTPNPFTFIDVTGATLSTAYESNTITVSGIDTSVAVTVTGGQYSKNGGAYTSAAGTAVAGDTFKVKVTSSASNGTLVDCELTIGGVSDTYSVLTALSAPSSFVTPGSAVYSQNATTGANDNWAATTYTAAGFSQQGTSDQYGYNEEAIASFCTPQFDTIPSSGTYYIGVTAWKAPTLADLKLGRERGIKEVAVSINNGAWFSVSTPGIHPVWGNECYLFPVRASDFATALEKIEVRAIAVPWVGKPLVVQGDPDPRRTNELVSRTDGWWSLFLSVDKGGALPKLTIYKKPAADPGASGDGTSAGQAVKTWTEVEAIADAWATANNGGSWGGITVQLTDATNHEQPCYATTQRILSVTGFRRFTIRGNASDPTLTQITVAGDLSKSIVAERLGLEYLRYGPLCQVRHLHSIVGTKQYQDTFLRDVRHNGDPAAIAATGQYTGPFDAFGFGDGYNEAFGAYAYLGGGTGFGSLSIAFRCTVHGANAATDAFLDAKLNIQCVVENFGHRTGGTVEDTSHSDALQFRFGRQDVIVEDMLIDNTAYPGVSLQGIFWDSGCYMDNVAIIRPRVWISGVALGVNSPVTNGYFLDPQHNGSGGLYNDRGRLSDGSAPWEHYSRNWRIVAKSGTTPGQWASEPRYGKTYISASSPLEINDQQPGDVTVWQTLAPGKVGEIIDAELVGTMLLYESDGSVSAGNYCGQIANYIAPTQTYVMGTSGGASVFERRPEYQADAFGGRPGLVFNPDPTYSNLQSGTTTTRGDALGGSFANVLAGAGEKEVWGTFDNRHPANDTGTRYFYDHGGGGTIADFAIRVVGTSGSQPTLVFRVGYAADSSGTGANAAAFTVPFSQFDPSGLIGYRVELLTAGPRVTLWKADPTWAAAHPNGLTVTFTYTSGVKFCVSNARTVLGGNAGLITGSPQSYASQVFNLRILCSARLSSTEATGWETEIKKRLGLAA